MKNQFIVWTVLVLRSGFLLGVKTLLAREYEGMTVYILLSSLLKVLILKSLKTHQERQCIETSGPIFNTIQ